MLQADEEADYRQACLKLKSVICELVNVYPEEGEKKRFRDYFNKLNLNWIVTTNYDTILESILTGMALPLNPAEGFIKIKNMVPVYHIHGIRTNPQSIVITNEDYISMFRPGDYRQARLPFLMKESTVLMVGYGFGDINVISAVDWSRNVYQNIIETCDTDIIQLLYCDPDQIPRPEPYHGESGIIVVEIRSIEEFFEALCQYQLEYTERYNKVVSEVSDHINRFITAEKSDVDQFIDNEEKRKETIDYIEQLRPEFSYVYSSYIGYLERYFQTWISAAYQTAPLQLTMKNFGFCLIFWKVSISGRLRQHFLHFWQIHWSHLHIILVLTKDNPGKHMAHGKTTNKGYLWKQ